jgi:hypothetical protein
LEQPPEAGVILKYWDVGGWTPVGKRCNNLSFSEAAPPKTGPNLEAGSTRLGRSPQFPAFAAAAASFYAGISFPLTWVRAAFAALTAEVMAL